MLLGIGWASIVPRWGPAELGLAGAIAVNIYGAGAVIGWLAFSGEEISARGSAVLWSIALLVMGIVIAELLNRPWRRKA